MVGRDFKVTNPQGILFDPSKIEDAIVRMIWKDDVARTIWIAVKGWHIVSQYFNEDVQRLARGINEHGLPITAQACRNICYNEVQGPALDPLKSDAFKDGDVFWEDLLLYINGEKTLEWNQVEEPVVEGNYMDDREVSSGCCGPEEARPIPPLKPEDIPNSEVDDNG